MSVPQVEAKKSYPLTDFEIEALAPFLSRIAGWFLKKFPTCRLERDDFIQNGWIGIITTYPRSGESPDDLLKRRIRAGKNHMIVGMRELNSLRPGKGRRKVEVVVDDFHSLLDKETAFGGNSYISATCGFQECMENLTQQERYIVMGNLDGYTLLEMAKQLGLTEGRLCQKNAKIKSIFREKLYSL